MVMWSPKGKLSCHFTLVQMYESLSWDDMDVELKVNLSTVLGNDVGGVEGDNDCKIGEKIGFGLDGG